MNTEYLEQVFDYECEYLSFVVSIKIQMWIPQYLYSYVFEYEYWIRIPQVPNTGEITCDSIQGSNGRYRSDKQKKKTSFTLY